MPSAAALAIERARSHQTFVRERALRIKEMSPAQIMTGGFPAIADLAFGSSLAQHTEQYQHYAGWAYVCISAIGRRVAGQPVRMGRKAMEPTAESWAWDRPPGRKLSRLAKMRGPHYIKALDADIEQIDTDPLLDAINKPNPVMTKWALLFHTIASLEITGRAYWWFTEGDEGELNIWPLPADFVTPIRTAEKLLAGYRIAPTGQFGQGEVVEPESIAYFGLPDPANPVTGAVSPLQAQAPAIAVDEQIQSSQYRFFKNGAFPGILIRAGRQPSMTGAGEGPQIELTQAQRSQIYAMVRQNWQGSVNYNMPLIVDGGLIQGVERFTLTGQELDFLQSGQVTKSRIFQSFGVNPIVAGEIAGVNRATAAVADSIFVAAVVNPLCTLIGEVMSAHIGKKDTYFWVELAQADDAELRLRQWQAFAPLGVVTKDEVRQEILGLPPVEDDTGAEYLGQSAAPPSPFGGMFGGGGPAFPPRPEEQNRLPPPEPETETEEGEAGKATRPFGKYSPDQPRVPAGGPEGGQFGEGGTNGGAIVAEGSGIATQAVAAKPSGGAQPKVSIMKNQFSDQVSSKNDRFNTAEKAADWTNRHFSSVTAGMTEEETDSIATYAGGRFSNINDGLRGLEEMDAADKEAVKGLDKAMAKSSLPEEVTVFRGAKDVSWLGDPEKLVGKTITEKGYTSTTLMQKVANGFANSRGVQEDARFEIKLPKGSNAVSVDSALGGSSLNQHELILPRGSKFKITGVERKDISVAGRKLKSFWVVKAELIK